MGDVEVVVGERAFEGLVDAIDGFGVVAHRQIIVAGHLEVEVGEHPCVINKGGDLEGRVVIVFREAELL